MSKEKWHRRWQACQLTRGHKPPSEPWFFMAAFFLTPSSRPQPLGLVPESESHAKCVNQRAGKYQLLAEGPWEGNVTPAVTLEQKKQAAASPLTTLSAPSNKDRGENEQAEGHFELQPWRKKHGRDMQRLSDPSGVQFAPTQAKKQTVCSLWWFFVSKNLLTSICISLSSLWQWIKLALANLC